MIKFFRKIRQNSIKDNKITNYLKYAIGEIILVVIGILLALQINNWNQRRLDGMTETKLLKSIEKELITNSIENKRLIINRLPKKIESLKLAKKFCENEIIVTDTLEFLNKVGYGGVFSGGYKFGDRSSYDELINTGNLQLISNDSIKKVIANYYGYINAVKQRTAVHSSRFSSYTSELRPFNTENPNFISKFDQAEMMQSFKTAEFRQLIDLELSYAYKVRDYIEMVEFKSEQAINLINLKLKDE